MSEVFLSVVPSSPTASASRFIPLGPQRSRTERRWFFLARKLSFALLAGVLAPAWLMADPAPTVGSALPVSATVTATATATARVAGSHPFSPAPGLPMTFELNQGQYIDGIKFRSRGAGYSVVLRSTEAMLLLGGTQVPKREEHLKTRRSPANRGHHREPPVQASASAVVHLSLVGANPDAEASGEAQSAATANYFIGNDPALWRTDVPMFEKVRYHGVYPGIDLLYYGNQRRLEYDFVVAAGADPEQIRIRLEGVDELSVDGGGDLIARIGTHHVRWQKPRAYQGAGQGERTVPAEYVVESANQFTFRVGHYDSTRPLIIDPVLVYSTYLGGKDFDSVAAMAVDNAGNVYVAGNTYSTNFPLLNAYQTRKPVSTANSLAFLTKLNSNGTALVYSTYFGGTSVDGANGLAVDASGNAYIAGDTDSPDFPTRNAFQSTKGNFNDAFLAKFGPNGNNLLYSTYYGDSGSAQSGFGDAAYAVAVNNSGGAYIVGATESGSAFFSKAPIQNGFGGGASDGLVAKFDTTQNGSGSLVWGSWLGGNFDEYGYGIALDASGNVYVTGTLSMDTCYDAQTFEPCPPDFPVLNAFQPNFGGDPLEVTADAFIVKLNNSDSPSRIFSTYFGGSDSDFGYGIAVDAAANIYVVGETSSTDFYTVNACQSFQADDGYFSDVFLAKFNSSGTSLLYSTYLGGVHFDGARSVVLDKFNLPTIVGYTFSPDFPVTPGAPQTLRGGGSANFNRDLFVAKVNPAIPGRSGLVFATYLGGSDDEAITAGGYYVNHPGIGLAVDTNLNIYVGSDTLSTNFPIVAGGFQTVYGGGDGDGVVAKISAPTDISVALTASSSLMVVGSNVVFTLYANNNGPTTFSNVTVSLPLAPAFQFVSGTNTAGTVSNSSGTVTWSLGAMTNGAANQATITATAQQSGTFTNSATISATQSDQNTNNNVSRIRMMVRGIADLKLAMTEAFDPVDFSSNVVYSLTLTNDGPFAASAINVTNPIPSGASYVAAFGGNVSYTNSGNALWIVSNLPSAGKSTLTLILRADRAGTITNQASASLYELDPNPANNSASAQTTVKPMADLAFYSIAAFPDPALATADLTYTIAVTNPGPTFAEAVQVVDTLPAGFTFVSAAASGGYTQYQGVVTCYLGTMITGAVRTATITAKPPVDGTVTNWATVSSTATDPVPTNNTTSVSSTVLPVANLALSISVSPTNVVATSNLVYTITVTNLGPTASYNVGVTDALPASLVYVSAQSSQGQCAQAAGRVTCDVGTIPVNGSVTVTVTAYPISDGQIGNTASVGASTPDVDSTNNSATTQATVTQMADLFIASITTAPSPAYASSNLTYTITATNAGPTSASGVQVVDTLPPGFTYISATPSGGATQFQGVVTIALGNIPSGSTKVATITARPPLDGPATNAATVSTSATDPVSGNNSSTLVSTISPLANLGISMSVAPTNVVATSNVVFTITVTNLGPTAASGVVVTDALPANLTFVSAQCSQGSFSQTGAVVSCDLGPLTNSGSATVTVTVATTTAGAAANTASVSAATTDPVSGNNSATAQATATQLADLSVASLTAAPDPVFASSNLTYTVIVTNAGPTPASAVQVVDALPAGFTFVTASAAGGFTQYQGVVTCSLGNMGIGITRTSTITAKPPLDGLVTNAVTVGTSATDPVADNNSAAVVSTVTPLANIGVGMSVSPFAVALTSNLVYTITVTNLGPTAAAGVVVTDALPASLVFVSAQSSQGSFSQTGAVVSCDLGPIAKFGSATVTVTASTTASGPVTNTASVGTTTTDPVSGNNSASATATVGQLADLSVASFTVSPEPVVATSNMIYTVIVTNAGPTTANSAQVVNVLPAGLSFVTATAPNGCTFSQGTVTCSLGSLPIGSTRTSTVTAKPSLDGFVTNTVTASTSSADPLPANNSASVVSTVSQLANLAIGNAVTPTTVAVTSNVVYTLSVTNLGPTAASNVTVTDPLTPNLLFVSAQSSQGAYVFDAGAVTCNLGTLTNNGRATVTITAAPMIEGALGNLATVAFGGTDPVLGNNTSSATVTVTNNPASPILRIARSGANVLLYWSTNSAGFALLSNGDVVSAGLWQPVTNTPVAVGTQYYVTNVVGDSPAFYRLAKANLPPVLTAVSTGTNVLVSWSTNLTGYFLQRNSALVQPNNWTTISNVNTVQNGRYTYTDSGIAVARFFRLVKFQ